MPCDSGPPLCGQRSRNANTRSAAIRKIAMFPPADSGRSTTRAPSTGSSSSRQMRIQSFTGTRLRRHCRERNVLSLIDAGTRGLVPWVGLTVERELQPLVQRAPAERILDDDRLDVIKPDASDVVHGALEIPAFFAEELQ